jgi:hypothetical protein
MRSSIQLLSALAIACFGATQAEEESTQWNSSLPVAISSKSSTGLKEEARNLKEMIRSQSGILESNVNPVCAFWIELWAPSEKVESGFIIQIESSGARISASDLTQLKKAIQYLKHNLIVKDEKVYLPKGIFTTYKVTQVKHLE